MILAVCPNPALDVTYRVDALVPGTAHRVRSVTERAGGKATNVASVLSGLGEHVALCGVVGGERGTRFRSLLSALAVEDRLTPVTGETRQSVAVMDDSDVTVLNEPGPSVTGSEWSSLVADVGSALPDAAAVVLAGSLPAGAPEDGYAQLVALARSQHVPVVLDTGGPSLLAALDAGPAVLAPNHHEVADALGVPVDDPEQALAVAEKLAARTGGAVVVSVGRDGLVAVSSAGRWRVRPPRVLSGNPTGAGDAVTAALARGVAGPLPDALAEAVALSGACVVRPTAGDVDVATYDELRTLVTVEEVR